MSLFPNSALLFGPLIDWTTLAIVVLSVLPILRRPVSRLIHPRRTSHRPLYLKFVAGATLVTLVPMTWVLLIFLEVHSTSRLERSMARMASVGQLVAKDVSEVLDSHSAALETLGLAVGRNDPDLAEQLFAFHERHPAFVTMLVTDNEGHVVAQSGIGQVGAGAPPPLGRSLADRSYFTNVVENGQPYISNALQGRGFGSDIIVALSAPILGGGIVQGSLLAAGAAARLDALQLDADHEILTADDAGKIVYASESWELSPLQPISDVPLLTRLVVDESPQLIAYDDRRPTHMAVATSASYGRTIYIRRPLVSLGQSIWSDLRWLVLLAFAAVVAGIAIGAVYASAVMRPVTRLAGAIAMHDIRSVSRLKLARSAALEIRQVYAGFRLLQWRVRRALTARDRTIAEREDVIAARTRELAERNRELTELARTDALTGLLNRRGFEEQTKAAMDHCRRAGVTLSLLAIDIDYFKRFNDRYGHPEGDQALIRVARELKLTARRATDIVARTGGEEFAMLLPDTNGTAALAIAEELRGNVRSSGLEHEDSPFGTMTLSVGVATLRPDGSRSIPELFKAADECLYRAKHAGRDRTVGGAAGTG